MSLLNSLAGEAKGVISGQSGAIDPSVLMGLTNQLIGQYGGVQGLLAQLQSGGMANAVASWVGTGPNQPVSAEQVQQAIGAETLNHLAQNAGCDPQAVAGGLANLLPGLIDQLSPSGQLPADGGAGALQGLPGGSVSLVGNLFGSLLKK